MPLTKPKLSQAQRVRGKSEIDDLFSRLMTLYQPGPFPPLTLPMFQGAERPVLVFPTLEVAQARVWRNLEGPHSEKLKAAIDAVCLGGLVRDQARFLIGLCEALFRPVLTIEWHLERLFPDFLFSRSQSWPPSRAASDLLASDFRQRWKEEEKTYGRQWVLAAGGIPLRLKHRPALIAPWVVGATVKRWLTLKGTPRDDANELASRLIAVLFGREVRAEEFRHWTDLIEKVLITLDDGNVPLPGYLIKIISRGNPTIGPGPMTPACFLEMFPIDEAACEQFAIILQQAWRRPNSTHHRSKTSKLRKGVEAISSPKQEVESLSSTCFRCNSVVPIESIYEHLKAIHQIDRELVDTLPNRRELRLLPTKEVLFQWRED